MPPKGLALFPLMGLFQGLQPCLLICTTVITFFASLFFKSYCNPSQQLNLFSKTMLRSEEAGRGRLSVWLMDYLLCIDLFIGLLFTFLVVREPHMKAQWVLHYWIHVKKSMWCILWSEPLRVSVSCSQVFYTAAVSDGEVIANWNFGWCRDVDDEIQPFMGGFSVVKVHVMCRDVFHCLMAVD